MKISLITACYNSAGTIRTAIESVLSQCEVDVEYIVVDGGSSDGTVEILKNYENKLLYPSTIGFRRKTTECTTPSIRASRWRRATSLAS